MAWCSWTKSARRIWSATCLPCCVPIAGFLAKNPAGGQHHLCFEVADIHAAIADLTAKGARVLGTPRIGAHGTPIVFVHPRDMGGVLIELMETPAEH